MQDELDKINTAVLHEMFGVPGATGPEGEGIVGQELESTEDDPESDHGPFMIKIKTACESSLNIAGEHFSCELDKPHDGLAHSNKKAQAIWL